jgi:hypothetical protein
MEVVDMIKCKVCNREFGTKQGLASHTGHAHRKKKPAEAVTATPPGAPVPPPVEPPPPAEKEVIEVPEPVKTVSPDTPQTAPVEPVPAPAPEKSIEVTEPDTTGISKAERIRHYLSMGYTFEQLTRTFNFPESSVYQEMEKVVQPEGKPEDNDREAGLPVTTKGTEVITPEAIMQRLANGSQDWHLRLEGMMLLRAAQRMNRDDIEMTRMQAEADATRIKPILELMRETRLEQDAAAQRAKESNIEIAERAAYDTAGQLSQVITQNNARITDSINQIRQALGGKEENPLGQVLNAMQSMQQMMQMFGVSMPGMAGGSGGTPAQKWQPPPITHRKRNESEGGKQDAQPATTDAGDSPGP